MKTIEQYIDSEMSGKIAQKRNSPFLALLVLAVGIGTCVLLCTVKMEDSLSATCLTIGLICTVLGLILTAMNLSGALTHFVYLPTQSTMREKKVYISGDEYKEIVDAVNNGNLQSLTTMRPVVSSNSAIRILASLDGECVLVQAIRDQSGHFEPETEVCILTGLLAASLIHLTK